MLAAISSNLFNQDNISSPCASVNIEGCKFVIGLSTILGDIDKIGHPPFCYYEKSDN